jgi:SsrA-binding protein
MADILTHKRARHDYEILDQFEAGIQLFGGEVKSLRANQGKLEGSHVTVRGGEAFLIGMEIPPYQPKNSPKEYDAKRNRRLLLTRKEIEIIGGKEAEKGLTIIPLSLYHKGRTIKVRLAIARGKKKVDKRESLKKREAMKDMARAMKARMR